MHQRKAQSEQERGFAGVTVVAIMDGVRLGGSARRSNKRSKESSFPAVGKSEAPPAPLFWGGMIVCTPR